MADTTAIPAEPVAIPRRFPPPALRVRTFRWYWLAQWPVLLGTWMQVVALGYLVYQQTHSSAAVGVVAAADGLPAIVLSPIGGVLADRLTRRRLLLITQSLLGVSAGGLALLIGAGHSPLWVIIVFAVVFGSADSVDLPTRQALIADLVDRDLIVSAMALGSVSTSTTRIVGPALGGLLLAVSGPAPCFAALAAAYVVPIVVLTHVVPDIPPAPRAAGSTALRELLAGCAAAAADPLLRAILLCAAVLSFLGVSYMPYLPVLAATRLHGNGPVLGLLYSTGGIGGLIGGLLLASLGRGSSRVPMLVAGGITYAAGLFTLSHSSSLLTALPALVAISFGFLSMNTSMTTLLQTEASAALRGRMLGLYTMIFAGLQPLGTLMYGMLSRAVPLFDAIGVGGLVVGAVAVVVALQPALRAVRSP